MRLPSIEPTLAFPPELLLAARGTGSAEAEVAEAEAAVEVHRP